MRLRDLQLLELPADASLPQIEDAYRTLLARYSLGSLPSYGLLFVSERTTLLRALYETYQRLLLSPPHEDARLEDPSMLLPKAPISSPSGITQT